MVVAVVALLAPVPVALPALPVAATAVVIIVVAATAVVIILVAASVAMMMIVVVALPAAFPMPALTPAVALPLAPVVIVIIVVVTGHQVRERRSRFGIGCQRIGAGLRSSHGRRRAGRRRRALRIHVGADAIADVADRVVG